MVALSSMERSVKNWTNKKPRWIAAGQIDG